MSSRDIVPYGGRRESARDRDLVPHRTGRESTQHGRQSTQDSRSHRTTTHGHPSHGDPLRNGYGREPTRRSERDSTRDSRSHRTITRGYTSHRDCSPPPSTSRNHHSPSLSIIQSGQSSRTLVRGDSRPNTNYAVTHGDHGRMSRHHNPVDEPAFSDDDGDLPMGHHGRGRNRRLNVIAEYEAEELPGGGHGRVREIPIRPYEVEELPGGRIREIPRDGRRQITHGPSDESDGNSSDEGTRHHTTHRTGSTRYPTTTGSSRHHTPTDSTRRGTLPSYEYMSHTITRDYTCTEYIRYKPSTRR
ncbi:hypothetical protein JMJ35_003900 [Cladonia borealis]|uniref:Uncharacterized protein n=1 Tax=Cladonia borealis TaxID=184061 RepID=A0AA39UBK4_9LECA|nr:hypothetical protein JMJ35_003900 [Cladonia borealis]